MRLDGTDLSCVMLAVGQGEDRLADRGHDTQPAEREDGDGRRTAVITAPAGQPGPRAAAAAAPADQLVAGERRLQATIPTVKTGL